MGLFHVNCSTCGQIHLWHSSSSDQRCTKCIADATFWHAMSHRLVRTIALAIEAIHRPTFLDALSKID